MKTNIALTLTLLCAALASAADQPSAIPPTLEAQLAEAKAQIAVYEKLVTQSNDLMQKQLPALQAEVDGLSKPLAIGEDAGFMQLADGRKFEHAVITAITPTSITIRCEREMATIPWKTLPLYFQVRAAHAVLATVNEPATPPPVTTAPAEPVGDRIYLGDISMRKVKESGDYVYYSWTAVIGNPTDEYRSANTKIFLKDAQGFQLADTYGDKQTVPPHSFRKLSGDGMVEKTLWNQCTDYRVELL